MWRSSASKSIARLLVTVALPLAASCSVFAASDQALEGGERCSASSKRCGDACVSLDDPNTGCASESCVPCAYSHASATCQQGECALDVCEYGYADCNGEPADGCESDLRADDAHCGACGLACPQVPARTQCVFAACSPIECNLGLAECDGDPSTVCETQLASDPTSCGKCGNVCALPHAKKSTCTAGECRVAECSAGRGDCNGLASDGCETVVATSDLHCGACNASCTDTELCSGGVCRKKCFAIRALHEQARVSIAPVGFGLGSGDFTVELWFERRASWKGDKLFTMNESNAVSAVRLSVDATSLRCAVYGPQGGGSQSGSADISAVPPALSVWTHVACQRSGGQLALYVQGNLVGTSPVGVDLAELSNTALGVPSSYDDPLNTRAAPVTLGPIRVSKLARFAGNFTPNADWAVDSGTVAQYLTGQPFSSTANPALIDEAGGDNAGVHFGGFAPTRALVACP